MLIHWENSSYLLIKFDNNLLKNQINFNVSIIKNNFRRFNVYFNKKDIDVSIDNNWPLRFAALEPECDFRIFEKLILNSKTDPSVNHNVILYHTLNNFSKEKSTDKLKLKLILKNKNVRKIFNKDFVPKEKYDLIIEAGYPELLL